MSLGMNYPVTYNQPVTEHSVAGAITLGNKALTRHLCDTGAFFTSALSSMAGYAEQPSGWSVPCSDCDNSVQSAAILLSPDVGGLQSKQGVPL